MILVIYIIRTFHFINPSILILIADYVSAIFVTYDDFSHFMSQHADDFCFWVDQQYLVDHQLTSNYDLQNILPFIFTEQIAYDVSWTSWQENDFISTRQRQPEINDIKPKFQFTTCLSNKMQSMQMWSIGYLWKQKREAWSEWSFCFENDIFRNRSRIIQTEILRHNLTLSIMRIHQWRHIYICCRFRHHWFSSKKCWLKIWFKVYLIKLSLRQIFQSEISSYKEEDKQPCSEGDFCIKYHP